MDVEGQLWSRVVFRNSRKQTSLRLASSLSTRACFALFSFAFSRSSASFCCFSSSVRGAISSVDCSKFSCWLCNRISKCSHGKGMAGHSYVFSAWNWTCIMDRNFLPQSVQTIDLASSPSLSGAGSMLGFVSSDSGAAAASAVRISSMLLSWLSSSHCKAPFTVVNSQYAGLYRSCTRDMQVGTCTYIRPSSWLQFRPFPCRSPCREVVGDRLV